jgi:glycosyltransferase involved in cell wall biosynthesis
MADRSSVAGESKKVLVITRSFPPLRTVGSSIRVVKFIKYLPALGWLPVVLTIDGTKEYESQRKQGSAILLPEIPMEVKVHRTSAAEPTLNLVEKVADAKKRGGLPGLLVRFLYAAWHWTSQRLFSPDPYVTWLPIAVWHGWKIAREERIDAILATCPAYSVALIGVLVKYLSAKPLILDFRDDWIDTPFYHSKPRLNRWIERWLERWAVSHAARVLLVTERSKAAFAARYPGQPEDKFVFLPNGCDLGDYKAGEFSGEINQTCFTIVHAGLLMESKEGPYRRSPRAFFQAVHGLCEAHPELREILSISFTGNLPESIRKVIAEFDLCRSVREMGDLPMPVLIEVFQQADLLLAINYDGWETIIPGKLYEYWAAGGPPVLLLSGPGAASELVARYNLGITTGPEDSVAIAEAIWEVYRRREAGEPLRINRAGIEKYDRKYLAGQLAQILDHVTSGVDLSRGT